MYGYYRQSPPYCSRCSRGPRADACGPYKATDVRGEDEATVTRGSEGVQGLIHHRREASQGHL